MFRDRQRAVVYVAVLSVAVSLSMVIVTFAARAYPIWPIIVVNWLLFMAVTWLVGHQVSLLGRWEGISHTNHNIWRAVILAFSGCGFIAIANGATIV
jgi:hypothetical protein